MDNISHTKSDTFIKNMTFKDADWTVIDITSSVITFTIKTNIDDVTPLIQADFTITDATGWLARLKIPSAEMWLDVGAYFFDMQWVDSLSIVRTIMKGNFIITYEITT